MDLYPLVKPLLFQLEAEKAHKLAIWGLKLGLTKKSYSKYSSLNQSLFGLDFENPLGIAAGFDKNGEVSNEIIKTGFGFAEVGSVTPKAQDGNPQPRLFRLEDQMAVINRMGFNNEGHKHVLQNLRSARLKRKNSPIGVNIGANKTSPNFIDDYKLGIEAFYNVADYFVANISSPNTPGLRALQSKESLQILVDEICQKRNEMAKEFDKKIPLILKIAPDLTTEDLDDIADIVLKSELDGVIVSNTTIRRDFIDGHALEGEAGGLSGKPLFQFSTHMLARFYQKTEGKIPLIGAGGIHDGISAYEKICAGASLLQIYSAMVYTGTAILDEVKTTIDQKLKEDGFKHISEAVGSKADFWAEKSFPLPDVEPKKDNKADEEIKQIEEQKMSAKLFHNPRCSKSRAAVQILDDLKIEYDTITYIKDGLSKTDIEDVLKKLDKKPSEFIRKKDAKFKEMGLSLDDEDKLIDAMIETPSLFERPVLVMDDKAILGRPTEAFEADVKSYFNK